MIRVHDRDLEAVRQVDGATHALVPVTGKPGTLPTDPKHLETMLVFCTNNWRTYAGEKPTGDKLARINAVHRQATLGDYDTSETQGLDFSTAFDKSVFDMWRSYKGTPQLMAKRRFIALLRDVDIRLLQVKAYQTIPWGFPKTLKGDQICPYSNAKKGCPRPLMDKYGHNLEHELDHNESLSDFVKLKKWLDEVAPQQRCSLGFHTPITAHMGSRFATFFARPECGSFKPYTPTGLHNMIKKVLIKQLRALVEMQNNPRNFSRMAQVQQRDRVMGLQLYYISITGNDFTNEVICTRDSHHCNTRRLAEGSNHTHPAVIKTPATDFSLYNALIQVRRECERLGVPPMTGPVHSIDQRCRLLQLKIVDFHRKKMLIYESQRRQQWRTDIGPNDAILLKAFARHHMSECVRDSLIAKDTDRLTTLLEAGADPASELCGGVFTLMTAVLKRSVPAVRGLLAVGADADQGNSRGMTALMWAVKRDDYAMVDVLLDEGADVGVEGCAGWTAMSVAARHARIDIAELLVDTLRRDKIVGQMNADRALNHRSTVNGGLTPVAVAAIHRDESMVRCLMRLGARPGVKCHKGYTAAEHAMKAGWKKLGLWLQETRAFGADGVYTFADMQAESRLRVSAARMLDAIASGLMVDDETKDTDGAQHVMPQPRTRKAPLNVDYSHRTHEQSSMLEISNVQLEHVRSNMLLTVKVVQEGHAAPDTETNAGHTALISAAYRGLTSGVRMLIQEGADPNYQNRNDRTALMAAAAQGHLQVVLTLLMKGAAAAVMDIDGKAAGAYAFEKGHAQVAELLAIAASHGRDAALDWEADRKRREEKENERLKTDEMLKKSGGGDSDVPEADLHDWMIRVTQPREAARLAELRQAARERTKTTNRTNEAGRSKLSQGRCGGSSQSTGTRTQTRGGRCPKCTLLVPCLHFASIEGLRAEFPNGTPEWQWDKRNLNSRGKPPSKTVQGVSNRGNSSGPDCGDTDRGIAWWKSLHQAQRDRSRTLAVASGIGGGL